MDGLYTVLVSGGTVIIAAVFIVALIAFVEPKKADK